jgi:hypothetical protein
VRATARVANREGSTSLDHTACPSGAVAPLKSISAKVLNCNVCRGLNITLRAIDSAVRRSAHKAKSSLWPSVQVDRWVRINSGNDIASSPLSPEIPREQGRSNDGSDQQQD